MNKQFKLAPLAVAVASLCFASVSVANENGHRGHHGGEGAKISKNIHVSKYVKYKGEVKVKGTIKIDSLGMAVIDDEQDSDDNLVDSTALDNNATLDGNAMRNAKGNLGVNISAGDNNVQGNSAALAAADASFVFGSSDAEIFVDQNADSNDTMNLGVVNSATFTGNAMRNAKGNIGVNVTAGNSNVQKNAFAAAVASGSMGEATVAVDQETENNITSNLPLDEIVTTTTSVSISGGMRGAYRGVGAGVYEGSESGNLAFREGGRTSGRYSGSGTGSYNGVNGGTYSGQSDQIGDVYPDIWVNDENEFGDDGQHEVHGNNVDGIFGHMDLDTQTEGGSDLNDDGGALAFNESGDWSGRERGSLRFREGGSTRGSYSGSGRGSYNGSEEGELGFVEAGRQSLRGSFTGEVVHNQRIYIRPQNDAHLGDNALRNAKGNIGVNITAGTNNLQNNSMAISSLSAADDLVPGGGNGGE